MLYIMAINADGKAFLNVEISQEQDAALRALLPWGTKRAVFGVLTDQLIKALQGPNRDAVLGAILSGYLDLVKKYEDATATTTVP